eukprot:2473878-Rhodomonas_salina.4
MMIASSVTSPAPAPPYLTAAHSRARPEAGLPPQHPGSNTRYLSTKHRVPGATGSVGDRVTRWLPPLTSFDSDSAVAFEKQPPQVFSAIIFV